ncbi:MAG: hypothetical protein IJ608_09950 [Lachnospiraceae bacterium]|nr:hypothetical protein [Lachnospiraceae bacterium]
MTELLEIRDRIKGIFASYEVFILPVVKFLLGLVCFGMLNSKLGYMTRINNIAVVLILALLCSFLPPVGMVLLAALISLLHLYALSLEAAIIGFAVYLVMFLLFFRFAPKDSVAVILTPITCALGLPCIVPISAGLLGGPSSAVSVGCGVMVYILLHGITQSAPTINGMEDSEATAKVRLVVDSLLGNKQMIVMIAAFAITVIVAYLVRRMAIDYSWTIAIIAGALVDIIILLVGDLMYDTNISFLSIIISSLLGALIGKLVEFFRFGLDYNRTEKVQFEDDEYYYYVKAVPKLSVVGGEKTVKRINTAKSRKRTRYEDDYYDRGRGTYVGRYEEDDEYYDDAYEDDEY